MPPENGIDLGRELQSGGYNFALVSTFNANLDFFDQFVLRNLRRGGCEHVILFMDARMGIKAIEDSPWNKAGKEYVLHPIKQAGAFHGKIAFLIGEKRAKLILGSHNFTLSGFRKNRELTSLLELNPEQKEDVELAGWIVRQFRDWMRGKADETPASLLEHMRLLENTVPWLKTATGLKPKEAPIAFGGPNESGNLLTSLISKSKAPISSIVCGGAFLDRECRFVRELAHLSASRLKVVVSRKTVSMWPPEPELRQYFYDWSDESLPYVHAKWFYMKCENGDDLLALGSPNPSHPAWIASGDATNTEAISILSGKRARLAAESLGLDGENSLPLTESQWEELQSGPPQVGDLLEDDNVRMLSAEWINGDLVLPLQTLGVCDVSLERNFAKFPPISVWNYALTGGKTVIPGLAKTLQQNFSKLPGAFWLVNTGKLHCVIANQLDSLQKQIRTPLAKRVSEALGALQSATAPSKAVESLLIHFLNYARQSEQDPSKVGATSTLMSSHMREIDEIKIAEGISNDSVVTLGQVSDTTTPISYLLELFQIAVSAKPSNIEEEILFGEEEAETMGDIPEAEESDRKIVSQTEQEKVDKALVKRSIWLTEEWKRVDQSEKDELGLPPKAMVTGWLVDFVGIITIQLHLEARRAENGYGVSKHVLRDFLCLAMEAIHNWSSPIGKQQDRLREMVGPSFYQETQDILACLLAASSLEYQPDLLQWVEDGQVEEVFSGNALYMQLNLRLADSLVAGNLDPLWTKLGFADLQRVTDICHYATGLRLALEKAKRENHAYTGKGDLLVFTNKYVAPIPILYCDSKYYTVSGYRNGSKKTFVLPNAVVIPSNRLFELMKGAPFAE